MKIEDDFDGAFSEATQGGVQQPGATAPAAPATQPAAIATEPQSEATAPPAPAPAPADDADPVKLLGKINTLQGILAKQGEELTSGRAKIKELESKPAAPEATPASAPVVDDDETALIEELENASPTVSKALKALLKKSRAEMSAEFEEKVNKRVEEITGQIAPLRRNAETQAVETHLATIEATHPDWQEVIASSEFTEWANKQPAYVQREMKRVSDEGTAAEVIDVLSSYRSSTLTTAATATGTAADAKRAQQRAALGTVSSKPATTATKGINKDNFDDAFAEAIAAQT